MKVLALDVGSRRIGIALGDTTLGVALARAFLPHDKKALEKLVELIQTEKIAKVLIGLPVNLEGNETNQTIDTDLFAQDLRNQIKIPIEFVDERFTSILAHANLRAADIRTKHHRPLVDSESARILLQTYFDRTNTNTNA